MTALPGTLMRHEQSAFGGYSPGPSLNDPVAPLSVTEPAQTSVGSGSDVGGALSTVAAGVPAAVPAAVPVRAAGGAMVGEDAVLDEGAAVVARDGAAVGEGVGPNDGTGVGPNDGTGVGSNDGAGVGPDDGITVGLCVGDAEGRSVGAGVVGVGVGSSVGSALGAIVDWIDMTVTPAPRSVVGSAILALAAADAAAPSMPGPSSVTVSFTLQVCRRREETSKTKEITWSA